MFTPKTKSCIVLKTYGKRILIILDGLDEHGLGQNEDVLKIIQNQRLLDCRILLSSRPHSTWDIKEYFPVVVRVDGFTEKEAKKFVSKFFADESRTDQIIKFKPSDYRENFPVHKCPILLSILCFLVDREDVDLSDTSITIGDLYFKMVKCLYKKYTIKKGVAFQESELIQVMKSVGQLALRTLLSNDPLLQRCEVLRIAGEFALEYGFFAGHEDFTDPAADIYVTYAHRSIEEFFGSFGFLQALDDGKSVDYILGLNCEKPIFMENPLGMKFCLWLLTTTQFSDSSEDILDKLAFYAAERMNFQTLDYSKFVKLYPAMEVRSFLGNREADFSKRVFEMCGRIQVVRIGNLPSEEVEGIVGLMSPSPLSNLTVLSIGERHFVPFDVNSDDFTIFINYGNVQYYQTVLKSFLKNSNILKRDPQMCARIQCRWSQNLSPLIQKHTKELNLVWEDGCRGTLSVTSGFSLCPQFTNFLAEKCDVDNSVPAAFMKAVKDGTFPNLRRIELKDCTFNDQCEWPEVPEFSLEVGVKSDASHMKDLILNLTELTVHGSVDLDRVITRRLERFSILKLTCSKRPNLKCLIDLLRKGHLPNLSELFVDVLNVEDRTEITTFLHEFDPSNTVKLEKLTLQNLYGLSKEKLKCLSEKLSSLRLRELNINISRIGSLSALFTQRLPSLKTLILRNCDLISDDLQSLSKAEVEGKLPQLRHLDISYNDVDISRNVELDINDLFTHSSQWNQLTTLVTGDVNVPNVEPQFLSSLEELHLSRRYWSRTLTVTRCWPSLKVIIIDDESILSCIADGVERGMFPSLATVTLDCYYSMPPDHIPTLFKLYKADIFVQVQLLESQNQLSN